MVLDWNRWCGPMVSHTLVVTVYRTTYVYTADAVSPHSHGFCMHGLSNHGVKIFVQIFFREYQNARHDLPHAECYTE
jgi:hypothetical protein